MLWKPTRLTPMSDPVVDAQLQAHAERLRALENDAIYQQPLRVDDGFDGIREYSRAWNENRTTAYLLGKSWADPLNRWFIVAVASVIVVGWIYLLSQ